LLTAIKRQKNSRTIALTLTRNPADNSACFCKVGCQIHSGQVMQPVTYSIGNINIILKPVRKNEGRHRGLI